MSDEQKTARPAEIHIEHCCEHPGCKRWGSFGYDVGKGATEWRCLEHRMQEYRGPLR